MRYVLVFILFLLATAEAGDIGEDSLRIGKPNSDAPKVIKFGPRHKLRTRAKSGSGSDAVEAGLDYCFVSDCINLTGADTAEIETQVTDNAKKTAANAATLANEQLDSILSYLGSITVHPNDDCTFFISRFADLSDELRSTGYNNFTPEAGCAPTRPFSRTRAPTIFLLRGETSISSPFLEMGFRMGDDKTLPSGNYIVRFQADLLLEHRLHQISPFYDIVRTAIRPPYFVKFRLASGDRIKSSTLPTVYSENECLYVFSGDSETALRHEGRVDCYFFLSSGGGVKNYNVEAEVFVRDSYRSNLNNDLILRIENEVGSYSFDIYTRGITQAQARAFRGE